MVKAPSMCDRAGQMANDYYNSLPKDTKKTVTQSFCLGVTVGILCENPTGGIVCGTLMGIATMTHALVTPLFKNITNRTQLYWPEEMLRTGIAIGAAYSFAMLTGVTEFAKWRFGFIVAAVFALFLEARCSTQQAQLVVI